MRNQIKNQSEKHVIGTSAERGTGLQKKIETVEEKKKRKNVRAMVEKKEQRKIETIDGN